MAGPGDEGDGEDGVGSGPVRRRMCVTLLTLLLVPLGAMLGLEPAIDDDEDAGISRLAPLVLPPGLVCAIERLPSARPTGAYT